MKRLYLIAVGSLLIPAVALACIWDYDTLKQERARFPGTLEIITGKFLRHSKEFYEWRIQDRLKKIAADPKNANLYDDLAVAYFKTGQPEKAIETMLKVEEFAPGRYETCANLSVFYFVTGKLNTALESVNKALKINPDAHFGREKYQKWLTECLLEKRVSVVAGAVMGNAASLNSAYRGRIELSVNRPGQNFSEFLEKKSRLSNDRPLMKQDYQAAVKATLGMMRFADHESPLLLEILGDLLATAQYSPEIDAKMLAAKAFLRASYERKETLARQPLRDRARNVLEMQTPGDGSARSMKIEQLEKEFAAELDEAEKWYSELHANEIRWIQQGLNPEEEFDKLYTEEPRVSGEIAPSDEYPGDPTSGNIQRALAAIASCFALFVITSITAIVYFVRRRRRRLHSLDGFGRTIPVDVNLPDFRQR